LRRGKGGKKIVVPAKSKGGFVEGSTEGEKGVRNLTRSGEEHLPYKMGDKSSKGYSI